MNPKAKELEKEFKESLKDFAAMYIALWNSLKSNGMTDPQVVGAIKLLFEQGSGTFGDATKEARQVRKGKKKNGN